MANHTKTLTITDTQQKILSNDLFNDTADNAGIDEWLDGALAGKIPSNKDDYVTLVLARADYKNRIERDTGV